MKVQLDIPQLLQLIKHGIQNNKLEKTIALIDEALFSLEPPTSYTPVDDIAEGP